MSAEPGTSGVLYELLEPDTFDPSEAGHEPRGGGEWFAESDDKLDLLETQEVVDVIDWDYQPEPDVRLTGPPEPVVDADGTVRVLDPTGEPLTTGDPINTIALGTFECAPCGTTVDAPPVDGELQPPATCPGCERQGPFNHVGLSASELIVAKNAGRMWRTPSGIADAGYSAVWDDITDFIRAHWDAGDEEESDAVYAGLTAYALSTWVREELTFVPHLMLMGKTTGGKTRLLNTLARVSYRAVVSASATPASMFRMIDDYSVSYYISEYHGLDPDARRELDNIVRAGQKRGEIVTRAESTNTGHEPMVFDPFSHVAIATQFEPSDDIVNRCIQVQSSAPTRDMPPTFDETTGEDLRNRLLYARFRLLGSEEWDTAEAKAYQYLADRRIDGRTREKLLSLVTAAIVWDRLDALEPFVSIVVQQDEQAAADSDDAVVVECISDLAQEEAEERYVIGNADPYAGLAIPYSDVAERYEQITGIERGNGWVGHVAKRLDLDKKRRSHGHVICDERLGEKLAKLCDDLNLEFDTDPNPNQVTAFVGENGGASREEIREAFPGASDGRLEHVIDTCLQEGRVMATGDGELLKT